MLKPFHTARLNKASFPLLPLKHLRTYPFKPLRQRRRLMRGKVKLMNKLLRIVIELYIQSWSEGWTSYMRLRGCCLGTRTNHTESESLIEVKIDYSFSKHCLGLTWQNYLCRWSFPPWKHHSYSRWTIFYSLLYPQPTTLTRLSAHHLLWSTSTPSNRPELSWKSSRFGYFD